MSQGSCHEGDEVTQVGLQGKQKKQEHCVLRAEFQQRCSCQWHGAGAIKVLKSCRLVCREATATAVCVKAESSRDWKVQCQKVWSTGTTTATAKAVCVSTETQCLMVKTLKFSFAHRLLSPLCSLAQDLLQSCVCAASSKPVTSANSFCRL